MFAMFWNYTLSFHTKHALLQGKRKKLEYGWGEVSDIVVLDLNVKDEVVPDSKYFWDQPQNDYKIQNLERIITKLKYIKLRHSTKCNFVNATTINFQGTHSKLFRHPSVQLKRLENWVPKTINIPKKRLAQKPKRLRKH